MDRASVHLNTCQSASGALDLRPPVQGTAEEHFDYAVLSLMNVGDYRSTRSASISDKLLKQNPKAEVRGVRLGGGSIA